MLVRRPDTSGVTTIDRYAFGSTTAGMRMLPGVLPDETRAILMPARSTASFDKVMASSGSSSDDGGGAMSRAVAMAVAAAAACGESQRFIVKYVISDPLPIRAAAI